MASPEEDYLQQIQDELAARGVTSPSVRKTSEAAASQLGIEEYSNKRNRELMKELQARGLKYEQGKLQSIEATPSPNPVKVASDLAKYSDTPEAGRIVARNLNAMRRDRQSLYESGKETLKNVGKTALETGIDFLGAGRNFTHHSIMAAGDENIDWHPLDAIQAKEGVPGVASGDLRKWAEKGQNLTQKALDTGLTAAGAPIAGLAALGNAGLQKFNKPGEAVDWQKAWNESKDFGKDVIADVVFDVSNLATFGGGTALKNLAKQGEKMALKSGMKKAAAKEFGSEFARKALTEKVGLAQVERYGTIGGGQMLKDLALKSGIDEAAFNKVAGESGEYLGKRGFAIAGQQVGNFEGSKTLQKGAEKLGEKMGPKGVILQLNPAQREAYLSSIARTKTNIANDARNMMANAIDKLPREKLEELAKDSTKFKEYLEGFRPGLEGYAKRGPYSMKQNIMKEVEAGRMSEDLGMQLMKDIDYRFNGLENTLLEKKAVAPVINHIRETRLFARPGYHAQNIKGDVLIGAMAGAETGRGWAGAKRTLLGEAPERVVFTDIAGTPVTQKGVKAEMKEMGLIGGSDRLTGGVFHPTIEEAGQYLAKKTGSIAQKFEYAPKGELAATVLTGGANRKGKQLASKWDDLHKTALYVEFRAQGLPPRAAADRVHDIAFNYADPGMFPELQQNVKRLQSFGGWGYKAATRIPKAALANPLKAKIPMNVSRETGVNAEYGKDQAPVFNREKYLTVQVPDIAKKAASKLMGAMGYGEYPEGVGMKSTMREPLTDLIGQGSDVGLGVQGNPALSTAANAIRGANQFEQPTNLQQELIRLGGGAPLEWLANESQYRFGTPNPFEYDISTTPERYRGMQQAAKTMGFFTGERFIPTTPLVEAQTNKYSKPAMENAELLRKAQGRTKALKAKAKDDKRSR